METVDFLTRICGLEGLQSAWQKVLGNGGGAGGDDVSAEQFQRKLKRNLSQIASALAEGHFENGQYKKYDIPKRNGEFRRLMVPCIADRIVHTSIAKALSPVLEPQFENSSFAYRPGRSVKQAVAAIERWRDEGYCHVIDADIIDYFPTIDHKILLSTLRNHIDGHKNTAFLSDLIADIIDHQGRQLGTLGRGVAQGSPLSPLLANLYLDHLDEQFEDKGVRIIRFADDFVILCKSDRLVDRAFDKLKIVLAELGLELNLDKSQLVDFDRGFEFLGYLFVRSLAMRKDKEGPTHETHIPSIPKKPVQQEGPASDILIPEVKGRTDYSKGDRILYVMERGRQVCVDRQNLEILTPDGHLILAVNSKRVDRLELGPGVDLSQDALRLCLEETVQLVFLNGWGQQVGRLTTNEDDRGALQFSQAILCAASDSAAILSRMTVDARIRNQRAQLFRLNRRQALPEVENILENMGRNLRKLSAVKSVKKIRGLEGASSALYWPALGMLCRSASMPFRRTRPATDPVNASINYLTAMLERDVRSAVRSAGLHVGFGYLHRPGDYREAAVYDLMEPFRAPLTEGLPVYLFNAGRLKTTMFNQNDDGTIWMNKDARSAIITAYEGAVSRRINIPAKKHKLSWRRMMWYQANSLAKAYRNNDMSLFTPYLMGV